VLSFVSEGVFERFPDLRVMVTECGFAWLPPLPDHCPGAPAS
jgi:predicted TIM-barrel fold metal-dependent hydrolase